MNPIADIEPKKFWDRLDMSAGPDGCWIWSGATNQGGYGRLKAGKVRVLAHRVAFKIKNGEIPPGKFVLHRCDNPPCCNPAHLFAGTDLDNVTDMHAKGRARKATGDASGSRRHPERLPRGENHIYRKHPELCVRGVENGSAKLNDEQAREIRRLYSEGGWTHRSLAARYGIRHSGIYSILYAVTWRHVA